MFVPSVSAVQQPLEIDVLATHRLFIEYDRETTEIVKPYRVLIEPKKVVAPRILGILAMRPEPPPVNP